MSSLAMAMDLASLDFSQGATPKKAFQEITKT
jgi:hypothetical protein